MNIIRLSLFIIVFPLIISAQGLKENHDNFYSGYVVPVGGDTLKGLIQFKDHVSNTRRCIVKESPSGLERIYLPDDLIAYGIANQRYFYAAEITLNQRESSKVFLEGLVKGKIDLLYFHDRYFVRSQHNLKELILVKEEIQRDGKSYTVKRPLYKSVLQKEMDDCPVIHEKLVNITLTEKNLIRLFIDYAECTGDRATVFEPSASENFKARVGFSLGILRADLNFKSDLNGRYIFADNAQFDRSTTFAPSILIELTHPRLTNRFHIQTGLTYYSASYETYKESSETGLNYDFTIEAALLEVPLLLKYNIVHSRAKISVLAGIGFNSVIKLENNLKVMVPPSTVVSEYNNDLNKKSYFSSAFLGGLSCELSLGRRSLLLEGYYYRRGSILESGLLYPEAEIEGFRFGAGMFF